MHGCQRIRPLAVAALALTVLFGAVAPALALPNPASQFCVQSGGKSEILTNAAGAQFGICILPDGQMVEEWAYYRFRTRSQTAPTGK
jgi:putative hemolysin